MMDVGNAIGPAFKHMATVLFKPFRFKLWLSLAFVSIFAASITSNFRVRLPWNGMPKEMQTIHRGANAPWFDYHDVPFFTTLAVLVAVVLLIMWISSVLRMVYIDQISRRSQDIKEPFSRLKSIGTSFFLWQLAFFCVLAAIALPIFWPLSLKMNQLNENSIEMIFATMGYAVLIAAVIGIPAVIVTTIASDFVATTMYAKNIKVLEAWKMVISILKRNGGQTLVYFVLLLAYWMVSAMVGFFVMFIALLTLALPFGLLAGIGYLIFTGLNLSWTPTVIVIAALLVLVVVFISLFLVQLLSQPLLVFRRAFAMVVLGQTDEQLVTIPIE